LFYVARSYDGGGDRGRGRRRRRREKNEADTKDTEIKRKFECTLNVR
jgi:hypothetical protein